VLRECYESVTRVLRECCESVARVLRERYTGARCKGVCNGSKTEFRGKVQESRKVCMMVTLGVSSMQ
jgi:hypothetical protein